MGKQKIGKFVFPQGTQLAQIEQALHELGLDASASSFQFFVDKATESHATIYDFLVELLRHEYLSKDENRKARWIIQTKLPKDAKSLADWDFKNCTLIDPVTVRELASCRFVDQGKNVVLLGPPGVGKTHLATAIAYEAIDQGKDVRFVKLNDFIAAVDQSADSSLIRLHRSYVGPKLLILDDIDYFRTNAEAGEFLFTVLKERYENKLSTLITSNQDPMKWDIFGKPDNIRPTLDRIFDKDRIIAINITGASLRIEKITKINPEPAAMQLVNATPSQAPTSTGHHIPIGRNFVEKHRRRVLVRK